MPSTVATVAGVSTDYSSTGSYAQFRNLLEGGDFTTNPFQRNIPGLATSNATSAQNNTTTYFADRWFGSANGVSAFVMSQVANNNVSGFATALQFGRNNTNANTTVLYLGQVLESASAIRCQGQPVTLSFWAAAGANFSAANNTATVQVISGTGTNQTAANMVAGNWTGQANAISANQVLTTTMTRYSFTGTVPANATQLGVLLSYTPVGTAGANDNFQLMGAQLELSGVASQFEHRSAPVELAMCQRYAWVIPEPGNNVVVGTGSCNAANNQTIYIPTPVQMRTAPTVTVSAGSFKVYGSTGNVANATGLVGLTTHQPNAIGLNSTGTETAGQAIILQGGGGNGYIVTSADF